MRTSLIMTRKQHDEIMTHLFPGDGLEAGAIGLCSLASTHQHERLVLHKVFFLPHDQCDRKEDLLSWDTSLIFSLLDEASREGYSVVKMHSHPGEYDQFSLQDNYADKLLFSSIHNWMKQKTKHFSAIFLPDGCINFREVTKQGVFIKGHATQVIGDDLRFAEIQNIPQILSKADYKQIQMFGERTHRVLKSLKIGVVGCSGTGSCLAEALKRHLVGEVVLIDQDHVEEKNLNRIVGATKEDADLKRLKVDVLKREILKANLGTKVTTYSMELANEAVIRELSTCDIIFGCVDTISGRHLLNLICTYFSIPYFDVGVSIKANGKGGVSHVVAASNYLQPGLSTLMSRHVYTSEALRAETMLLQDPLGYEIHKEQGYIEGVIVEQPAVYSINNLAAGLAWEDFLARLQGYRNNKNCAQRIFSFTHDLYMSKSENDFEIYHPWIVKVGLGNSFFINEGHRLKTATNHDFRIAEINI